MALQVRPRVRRPSVLLLIALVLPAFLALAQAPLQSPATDSKATTKAGDPQDDDEPKVVEPPKLPDPPDAKRVSKEDSVWVDRKGRKVYVDGVVSLREGYLEMFACLVNSKEHESVVAAKTKAATVHAALLAVGAVAGNPAQYIMPEPREQPSAGQPDKPDGTSDEANAASDASDDGEPPAEEFEEPIFKPATGTEIEVEVHWLDPRGKWQSTRAQEWIREVKSKKKMSLPWVFGGSGFWKDDKTGKEYYMAEAGDFICVSNFSSAMLDVPIESSQVNNALLFEANTEKIPPLGMPVRLVLTPKLKAEQQAKPQTDTAP